MNQSTISLSSLNFRTSAVYWSIFSRKEHVVELNLTELDSQLLTLELLPLFSRFTHFVLENSITLSKNELVVVSKESFFTLSSRLGYHDSHFP